MKPHSSQEGQCQCGNIQFYLTGQPLMLYVCHCLHCQKQSSSAFGLSLIMPPDSLKILSGKLKFWTTQAASGTKKICAFCDTCGTRIYHASEDKNAPISIKAGALNDTSNLYPAAHIWTKHAQPWIVINRELYKCYEEEPDDEDDELLKT